MTHHKENYSDYTETDNHRGHVGRALQWDEIGKIQFEALKSHGLKPKHTVLDIGCGSMRAGVHLIPYLSRRKYFGIDSEKDVVLTGLNKEIPAEIIKKKKPSLDYNCDFELDVFGKEFDFLLAQSIFTHTSPQQLSKILQQASLVMSSGSKFLATFLEGPENNQNPKWSWSGVYYKWEYIQKEARKYNLAVQKTTIPHPRNQTWILIQKGE